MYSQNMLNEMMVMIINCSDCNLIITFYCNYFSVNLFCSEISLTEMMRLVVYYLQINSN